MRKRRKALLKELQEKIESNPRPDHMHVILKKGEILDILTIMGDIYD